MDEEYQPYPGMWTCFPCVVLWKWGKSRMIRNDPEREPLYPSPHTILTAPSKKQRPNLSNLHHSSHSSSFHGLFTSEPVSPTKSTLNGYFSEGKRNASTSKSSEEGRERLGSISRAYGGRMQFLAQPPSIPSTPSLPSTPHLNDNATNGNSRPRPLSALTPMMTSQSQDNLPFSPSVPNLGRSSSEPRNLNDLGASGDFAPHQIPNFGSGCVTVGRRGSRGRKRSATTSAARLSSPLALNVDNGNTVTKERGRSPGPASLTRIQDQFDNLDNPNPIQDGEGDREEEERYIPMGRSLSHPELTFIYTFTSNTNTNTNAQGNEHEGEDEVVVKRELGLRGLYSVRGGKRGRGRGVKRIRSD
ncbi:hypothetical protein L486_02058 [Kwoniella mangroviensis CBS 10435]|uniref:Uncharacterized protein n=1 Tax=Kwoniella mangroviensis CBS 10435 TaxID=1331196 RepID=A0A1B9IV43_9TREE|nr:hypothetical protein L486_02058 [Kwoniella mangroviensis CBS 10435]